MRIAGLGLLRRAQPERSYRVLHEFRKSPKKRDAFTWLLFFSKLEKMPKVEKTSKVPKEKRPAKVVSPRQLEPDWRLSLIRKKEELGSIKLACEEFGVSRPTFYKIHKECSAHGDEALKDQRSNLDVHPNAVPMKVVECVIWWAEECPTQTTEDLVKALETDEIFVSATTVNKILREQNLGRAQRRRANWKMRTLSGLDASAVSLGHEICQFVVLLGSCPELGTVYVHAVVDMQSSWVWARAQIGKRSEDAIALLKEEVLPCYYKQQGLRPRSIETPSSRVFNAPPVPEDLLERRKWKQRPENAAYWQKIERDIEELQRQGYSHYEATREAKRRRWARYYGKPEVDNSEEGRRRNAERRARWGLAEQQRDAVGWRQYTNFLYGREIEHLTVTRRGSSFNKRAENFHDALLTEFFTADIRASSMVSLAQSLSL